MIDVLQELSESELDLPKQQMLKNGNKAENNEQNCTT